jgi:hypothetical protein
MVILVISVIMIWQLPPRGVERNYQLQPVLNVLVKIYIVYIIFTKSSENG